MVKSRIKLIDGDKEYIGRWQKVTAKELKDTVAQSLFKDLDYITFEGQMEDFYIFPKDVIMRSVIAIEERSGNENI